MATHDYVLDNASGAAFRTDLNNALSAIATNNSNSSDPSTTFASQYFADTSNSLMKLRNTSNNAYVNLFSLAGGPAFSVDGTINSVNIGKGANSVAGNTVLGEGALDASVSGGNNTAIGLNALTTLTSGTSNTAIGKDALELNSTGSENVAVGANALDANSTGAYNVAVGKDALTSNTSANNNTAVGFNALGLCETGAANVAVGYQALDANTTGELNVAVGENALSTNTTASNNVAIGRNALLANTTASNNTAIGLDALAANSSAADNTCVGSQAGDAITSGTGRLTIIGRGADVDSTSRHSSIALGYNVTTAGSNATFRVEGGNGVFHTGNTTTWSTTSDQRIKKDIVDNEQGLDVINAIRVRNFNYKTADEIAEASPELAELDLKQIAVNKPELQIGAIAQEIETVLPECVMDDDNGIKQVNADRLIWHAIKAIQELSKKVSALESF